MVYEEFRSFRSIGYHEQIFLLNKLVLVLRVVRRVADVNEEQSADVNEDKKVKAPKSKGFNVDDPSTWNFSQLTAYLKVCKVESSGVRALLLQKDHFPLLY